MTTTEATGPARELTENALPGTRFYAPKVLLKAEDGSDILVGNRPVNADIVNARVTQTNHGVSQVSVTLNNQRHQETEPYRPIVPIWKYNSLEALKFGQRIRILFRYGQDTPAAMILARITDVDFGFPASGGAQITLKGEDLLSLLKTKPSEDKRYNDSSQQEIDIVNDVLNRSGCGLPLATAERETFSQPLPTTTHQKTQTYLQFIESLAERMDYEVFVDFDDPNDPNSAVSFHFEPARSRVLNGVVDLTWNKDLVEFKPKFKVWDVYTDATASGRDPRRRSRFDEEVSASEIDSDLHAAPEGPRPSTRLRLGKGFSPKRTGRRPIPGRLMFPIWMRSVPA